MFGISSDEDEDEDVYGEEDDDDFDDDEDDDEDSPFSLTEEEEEMEEVEEEEEIPEISFIYIKPDEAAVDLRGNIYEQDLWVDCCSRPSSPIQLSDPDYYR